MQAGRRLQSQDTNGFCVELATPGETYPGRAKSTKPATPKGSES